MDYFCSQAKQQSVSDALGMPAECQTPRVLAAGLLNIREATYNGVYTSLDIDISYIV